MDIRYEVAEESGGNGQSPDDVFLVVPVVDVDELRHGVGRRRRLRRRVKRLERQRRQHQDRRQAAKEHKSVFKLAMKKIRLKAAWDV